MAKLAIFTERSTLRMAASLSALFNFRQTALEMGHHLDFVFKNDFKYFDTYDAIFIRSLTDPLNNSYVVARMAELKNIRVLDKSSDIRICSDKVNMYLHLKKAGVPFPETLFLKTDEIKEENASEYFEQLGVPLVLKAPNSSFSAYVDKVATPAEFVKIAKKFSRRSDLVITQQYLPSRYDWRVIILDRKVISVVKYIMDPKAWKILDHDHEGKLLICTVEGMDIDRVNPALLETAMRAADSIGDGLYGIDLKEVDSEYFVIEVNDNPNIDEGLEDQKSPLIYEWIIRYLTGQHFDGL